MTRRAVIVGAGVGGLGTAIGLRDAGWSVTVLERWPRIVGLGAALGVWPDAQRGLATLGIDEQFQHDSVPVAAAGLYRPDGRALVRLPEGSKRAPAVRLISRRRLMELLVAAADGVEIRTGVSADADTLHGALDAADVLIGADGLRSDVRATFFGPRTRPRYSGLVGWRAMVAGEFADYGETWGDGLLFGITPVADGRTNWYAAVPAPESEPGTFATLREAFAGWHDPIPALLAAAEPDQVLRNPIYDLHPRLDTFVRDRVALLGDAAHAMTPHLGRGACEAISDAISLVRHLNAEADVPTALRRYDAERRRPAQRIAARSWRMMQVTRWRVLARPRDGLLRVAGVFA